MKIKSIVDFIITEGEGLYGEIHRKGLLEALVGHLKYGTLITLTDDKGVYALVRLNIDELGTPHVINAVIRKDKRGTETLKDLIRKGREQFPNTKYITFRRGKKYHNRKIHHIDITKI